MSPSDYDAPTPEAYPTSPTTTRYPWRATLRAVIVAGIALLPVLPDIARAAQIETVPAVVTVLAVAAAAQRILSTPSVETWLQNTFPHIASVPRDDPQALQLDRNMEARRVGRHRKD